MGPAPNQEKSATFTPSRGSLVLKMVLLLLRTNSIHALPHQIPSRPSTRAAARLRMSGIIDRAGEVSLRMTEKGEPGEVGDFHTFEREVGCHGVASRKVVDHAGIEF